MKTVDRRKYPRLIKSFQVQLMKEGLEHYFQGMSTNLSQGGAFIKTKNWRSFKVDDQAVIAFYLPAEYTGQTGTIGLQGRAVIARVDHEQKGIGVKFMQYFRQFEPISPSRAAGQD